MIRFRSRAKHWWTMKDDIIKIPNISLGNFLKIITLVGGFAALIYGIRSDLDVVKSKLETQQVMLQGTNKDLGSVKYQISKLRDDILDLYRNGQNRSPGIAANYTKNNKL
jgi:hypothetical protein